MKRVFAILAAVLLTASLFAQAPQKMSCQAVIRDVANDLVLNHAIGMRISILQDGSPIYVETHTSSTNDNGLVTIEIGGGTFVSGVAFSAIDWSAGEYSIKTETDPTGGVNYTAIVGTSQLLSVPYALQAKTAEALTGEITESQISDLDHFTTADETDPSVPTGTQTGEMQYWNGSAWITVAAGSEGQMLSFVGGVPTWTTVVGVTTAGPTDVFNPSTGKIWMSRNLGASQVATSSTDAASYGDLYQWGRSADGHESRTSGTTSTLSSSDTPAHGNFITSYNDWRNPQNDNLWQGVSGINNPCPSAYRLPTEAEWEAERASWSSNNSAGAFASPLKLPVAGYRHGSNGSLFDVGSFGFYWTSTVGGTGSWGLYFSSSDAGMYIDSRACGFSVRCLKD